MTLALWLQNKLGITIVKTIVHGIYNLQEAQKTSQQNQLDGIEEAINTIDYKISDLQLDALTKTTLFSILQLQVEMIKHYAPQEVQKLALVTAEIIDKQINYVPWRDSLKSTYFPFGYFTTVHAPAAASTADLTSALADTLRDTTTSIHNADGTSDTLVATSPTPAPYVDPTDLVIDSLGFDQHGEFHGLQTGLPGA